MSDWLKFSLILKSLKIVPVKNKEGDVIHYKFKVNAKRLRYVDQEAFKKILYLKEQGLNQQMIAKEMKLSQSAISKILRKGLLSEDVEREAGKSFLID